MPERRRHLHRMHHAGLSGQVHAVYEPAAGFIAFFGSGHDVRPSDSRVTPIHAGLAEQGTTLEESCEGLNALGVATRAANS